MEALHAFESRDHDFERARRAEDEKEIGGSTTEEEEYRPLKNYTGTYPILPEARPVRRDIM